MQMPVVDTKGKSAGRISLPDEIFAAKAQPRLLAQAVRVFLANQRQATPKVKTRGEVSGSGKKIWRQKGTGRARHGDRYAPIFVGGGIAHGPRGNQAHKAKISKKMRRRALFAALSHKVGEKKLIVVDGFESLEPKTKLVNSVLEKLTGKSGAKISIILPDGADSVARGARNLEKVKLLQARKLNAYEVLKSDIILLMKNAAKPIAETFLGEPKEAVKQQPASQKRPAESTKRRQPKTSKRRKT